MKHFYHSLKPLVILLAIICFSTSIHAYDFIVDGLCYYKNSDGISVTLTYNNTSAAYNNYSGLTTANIPSTVSYDGTTYTVTQIGYNAFWHSKDLTRVIIPNSVTSISSNAFVNCISLTNVTIGSSVTFIGDNAFPNCYNITQLTWNAINCTSNGNMTTFNIENVTIGNIVQTLPANFVSGSKIMTITIPSLVSSIGSGAFSNCVGLKSINIKNKCIGNSQFSGCTSLTSVIIPNSVTTIGSSAFQGCTSLTSITIPNSVTTIGSSAFQGCTSLTSITIPNSVTTIGSNAFYGCSGLTKLTWNAVNCTTNGSMPTSIETVTIGNQVQVLPQNFVSGSKITSVTIPNSVTSIGEGAFAGCTSLTSVTIPNSVTTIGSSAFSSCSGLTSVTIPNSVTTIGSSAFNGCSGLRSINIPGSVTDIGYGAFSYCTGLMSARIANNPSNSTVVGNQAFAGCEGLTSVILPASLSALGSEAFAGCTGLTDVTCMRPRPVNIDASVFKNVPVNGGCDLHVPEGSKIRYEAMAVWQDFLFIFEDAEDPGPSPNPTNGDVNGDGRVNVSDITTLVNIILGII